MSWDELAEMGTYEWISKEDYLTYYTYKTIDPKTGKEKGLEQRRPRRSSRIRKARSC